MTSVVESHVPFTTFPASGLNATMQFTRLPEISFVCQKFNLPDVFAEIATQKMGGVDIKYTGNKLHYENLSIKFLVDEDFRAHREVYDWLVGSNGGADRTTNVAKFIEDQSEYIWPSVDKRRTFARSVQSNASLIIVNGLKTPVLRVVFYDIMPVSLGKVEFDITTPDPLSVLTASASFTYNFYEILEIKK